MIYSKFLTFLSNNKFYLLITCIILVIIFDSNFSLGLTKSSIINTHYKILVFFSYVIIFIITAFLLLAYTKKYTNLNKTDSNLRLFYISIFSISIFLSVVLLITIGQMYILNKYSNISFYLVSFTSILTTIIFSFFLSIQFIKWFLRTKNYTIFSFVLFFSIYIFSIVIGLAYLNLAFSTFPDDIKPKSPRALKANLYNLDPLLETNLAQIYNICFFISSILAWSLTVLMLKQYSHRVGRFKFWILVSLPMIFFILRFGIVSNYLDYVFFINLPSPTEIHPSITNAIIATIINSKIQIVGIFFAFSFVIIARKLKNHKLKNNLMISVIGLMLLFSSREFQIVAYPTFPPGGLVTISYMSIGSFLLLVGFISFIRLASIDRKVYNDLVKIIETDKVIRNIIFSEIEIETMNTVKPLIDLANKWEKENEHLEIKIEDVKETINHVISELREKKNEKFDDK